MSLNAKFSHLLNKILSVKDEDEWSIDQVESRASEDAALKQGIEGLESQELARKRKLEAATENSNKLCLDLQVDALSKSSDLRLPVVLRDAHVETLMKEKSALQEDLRGMRIKKNHLLVELQSLTLEAGKLCSDEVDEKSSEQDDPEEVEFAALAVRLEAAQEKDLILSKDFEETATVLLRDQNDIKHILHDLADITRRGESVRELLETETLIDPDVEFHSETLHTENELKKSSNVSNVSISRLKKDIEDKSIKLKNALEEMNKILKMEGEDKRSLEEKKKILEELTSRLASVEDDGHNDEDQPLQLEEKSLKMI